MRALKTIGIILAVLIGLFLILSVFGPKTMGTEKSTTIKASPELIYTYAKYLQSMDEWGVWHNMDKDAKYTLEGTDGTVGAKQSWDGDTVRQGSMTITKLVENERIETDLAFGDFMTSDVAIVLAPKGDSTVVTWTLNGEVPFMGRAMMLFMGGDVGKDFEDGLANLKRICEAKQADLDAKAAKETSQVMISDRPAMFYIGVKSDPKLPWSDISKFFAENMPKVYAAVTKAGVEPVGSPTGVYFDWNEENKTTSVMAAIPVAADAKGKVKGFAEEEVAAGKAYWTEYKGGYHGMEAAHMMVNAKLDADAMIMDRVVVEEYVTDPMTVKDSMQWVTNIIYMAKTK